MDRRGGCCIARYAGGDGGAYDMSKADKIMLRFRPIAPKPATVAGSSASGGGSSPEVSDVSPRPGRGKRKYNTASNGNNSRRCNGSGANRKRKALNEDQKVVVGSVVTLNLLPETPAHKALPAREVDSPLGFDSVLPKQGKNMPTWLSFGGTVKDNGHDDDQMVGLGVSVDRTAVKPKVVDIVGSCVTVECVTDTWVDVYGLGWTDEEKKVNLERDTCPGFTSDGYGRVTWINEAYRKMVGQGESGDREQDPPVFVWLVMKEKVPVRLAGHKAFTCRVRVQYQKYDTCGVLNGKEKSSTITVPCDVWRMDGGGFAWRLDVKAALCLGR